jgi:hypothetical protein
LASQASAGQGTRPGPRTAKPRPFKGAVLSGLWKAHFVDARVLPRKIYNEWDMFNEKSNKFAELCKRVATKEAKAPSPHDKLPGS